MTSIAEMARKKARIDLIKQYPFEDSTLMRQIELEQLGVVNRQTNMKGGEIMLQEPPEGVISGDSIPPENEKDEFAESCFKAKERRIKSLERGERLKKEIEVT